MKLQLWITLVLLTLFVSSAVAAQTTAIEQIAPAKAVLNIAKQPGCPVTVVPTTGESPVPTNLLEITTNESRPIIGYTLLIESARQKRYSLNMRLERFLEPGRSVRQGVGFLPYGEAPNLDITVDFVRFQDGGTWGADTVGSSKTMDAYLAGRELARKRIDDIAGPELKRFLKATQGAGGMISGGSIGSEPRSTSLYRLDGYRSIIRSLRVAARSIPGGRGTRQKT